MASTAYRLGWLTSTPDPEEFKRWLAHFDLVRGIEYDFDFTVTNEGSDLFPGGKIQMLRFIEYGSSIGRAGLEYRFENNLKPIPKLEPHESQSLGKFKFVPSVEGVVAIDGNAVSVDNKPIEWALGAGTFRSVISGTYYIVDLNKLRMLNMLDKLIKLKE